MLRQPVIHRREPLDSSAIMPQSNSFLVTSWAHISIGRDRSNRLHLARCLRCGQMIAAGKERKPVEDAATRHSCDHKFAAPVFSPSRQR